MKVKNGIEKQLWKNFWVMILMAFMGIAIPYFMIAGLSYYYESIKYNNIQTAQERMQDDYKEIQTTDIVEQNGGVCVVTGELEVINLAGTPLFETAVLTKAEWADFLQKSGTLDIVGYDIAYNEKEDFWLIISVPVALTIRIDYAANSDAPANGNALKWLLFIVGCYFLLIGLCAVLYAKIISKRLTIPIKSLCQFTMGLERGEYRDCTEDSKIVEIRSLQKGLNHLSQELSQHEQFRDLMEEQQRQLVMEISHDLKNPLASIQGYSELLLNQEQLTEEKKQNYLEMIHFNGVRANELLLNLFYYSQIENREYALNLEKTNICEILRLVMADYIPVIEEHEFLLEAAIPEEDYFCEIDIKMFRRALDNLFWNAIKYNQAGTAIQVRVSRTEKNIDILFSDNGKGIPRADVEKIFQPFKRLDGEVRNSQDGGSGLGLAIVKRLITLHHGSIVLHSDIGQGCQFVIELPVI